MAILRDLIFSAQHIFSALRDQPEPLNGSMADLLPYGLPDASNSELIYIHRHGYISAFDPARLVPRWVCWRLRASQIDSLDVPRRDCFERDESLAISAMPSQYDNSGFDLGHMCDCEDMSYSVLSQRESFILSNIAPQAPHFNRGIWGKLEHQTRNMVKSSNSDHWILAACVYDDSCAMLDDSIVIPKAFEKIIINMDTHQATIYGFEHTAPWGFSDDLGIYKTDKLTNIKIGNVI